MHGQPIRLLAAILLALPAAAQTHERVDLNSAGQPADATAMFADMSEDARFVVFTSRATNLGGSTVPGVIDVFLRDRELGTTLAITSSSTASDATRLDIVPPCISRDGSIVTFARGGLPTPATAFVYDARTGTTTPLVLPGLVDVRVTGLDQTGTYAAVLARTAVPAEQRAYRVHLASGALVLCSQTMTGSPVASDAADIDDDGLLVAFSSAAAGIFANDTNGAADAFVLDIPGNVMMCASVDAGGIPAQGALWRLSGNGRYVAFRRGGQALVRDLRLATTDVASLTTTNVEIVAHQARKGAISPDGSMTAFDSGHPTTGIDNNGSPDLYVRDSALGTLVPATLDTAYPLDVPTPHRFSLDGRTMLYTAVTTPTPSGSGQFYGVYVADYGPRCSTAGYCTSLPNSTGQPATIGAQGDASRALNNLVIAGTGLPPTANAMLVSGTGGIDPGTPFGNGLMCIGGALIRHGVHVASGGVILDAQDMHAPEYAGVQPGDTRYYQIVYRDPPAGGALFNTTDAVAVTFCW